jgi:hypothetical protein
MCISMAKPVVVPTASSVTLWVVYENPLDYPDWFVARRFDGETPAADVIQSRTLWSIQFLLRARGLTRIERDPKDEPHIVEVWV